MSKVAVVGVHGVADQQAGETVRSITSLLQTELGDEAVACGGFVEELLNLPIEAFDLSSRDQQDQEKRDKAGKLSAAVTDLSQPTGIAAIIDAFDERTRYQKEIQASSVEENRIERPDPNLEFMLDQVRHYRPRDPVSPDRGNLTYDTIRLRGEMHGEKCAGAIDVYEMYWADLSRLGSGWYEVLTNFYQLLFHVCGLGRLTLHNAEPDFRETRLLQRQWTLAFRAHSVAAWGVTLFVPILTLCLLAVLLLVLPSNIPEDSQALVAGSGALLIALGGWTYGRVLSGGSRVLRASKVWWIKAISVITGVALAIVLIVNVRSSTAQYKLLAIEWGIVATALFAYAINSLGELKEQARIIAPVCWLLTVAAAVWRVFVEENNYPGLASAAIEAGVLVLLVLLGAWTVMCGALILAALATFPGWLQLGNGGRATRRRRALGTAFISLILPITLFSVVTISLFTPLFYLANQRPKKDSEGHQTASAEASKVTSQPKPVGVSMESTSPPTGQNSGRATDDSKAEQKCCNQFTLFRLPEKNFQLPELKDVLTFLGLKGQAVEKVDAGEEKTTEILPVTLHDASGWMFQVTTTALYPLVLFIWLLAAAITANGFFWSVFVESTRPKERDTHLSRFVGESLSRAFGRLGFTFLLLFLACPFVFWVGAIVDSSLFDIPSWSHWINPKLYHDWSGTFITAQGALLAGLILTGKLDDVVKRVWPPLDIVLDVDNYLRQYPDSGNPKARIAARFLSLLKFLATENYDAVVIIAHSQGSVITGDLLRFLRQIPDPKLVALGFHRRYQAHEPHDFPNLFLITMGCPLRQLYGWRFPSIYDWARHEGITDDEHSAAGRSNAGEKREIGTACKPEPRELGLARWINAYCSGDYVGRHLWRDDNLGQPEYNSDVLFTPWDQTSRTESRDHESSRYTRRELCFGAGAHTHYFQDNASDIALLVKQLLIDQHT